MFKKCSKIHSLFTIKKNRKPGEKHPELSEEEKSKEQKYKSERNENFKEDEKESLVKYEKKYYKI